LTSGAENRNFCQVGLYIGPIYDASLIVATCFHRFSSKWARTCKSCVHESYWRIWSRLLNFFCWEIALL